MAEVASWPSFSKTADRIRFSPVGTSSIPTTARSTPPA
jgi:hypothetical protein